VTEALSPSYYQDRGCQHAPKCLSCPLERCVHDDPMGAQRVGHTKRDVERANAVLLARKTMARLAAAKKVAKDYGVTERTIHRIMQRMGL